MVRTVAPSKRTSRLAAASRRASVPSPETASQGGTAPPRLAPATSTTASGVGTTPEPSKRDTKRTTARLDDDMKASIEATNKARSGASPNALRRPITMSDWRRGSVTDPRSFSDNNISPRPRIERPRPLPRAKRLRKLVTTPIRTIAEPNQCTSKESTRAATAVPTFAPSITAWPIFGSMMLRPAKEAVITAVAVLDCIANVAKKPEPAATMRLPVPFLIHWRSEAPKALKTPVLMRRNPQIKRAPAPRRSINCIVDVITRSVSAMVCTRVQHWAFPCEQSSERS